MVSIIIRKFHEYTDRAEDTRACAETATDLLEKAKLLAKSRHWQRLADSYRLVGSWSKQPTLLGELKR